MDTPGIRDRLGGVGNQFAITTILSFLISLPFLIAKEGSKFKPYPYPYPSPCPYPSPYPYPEPTLEPNPHPQPSP